MRRLPPTSLIQQQVLRLQVTVGDADAVQIDLGMERRVSATQGSSIVAGIMGIADGIAAAALTTPAISCWKKRCASGSGIPISGST